MLIVVSSYRPAMLADMQRARALAWELPALNWDVEILTPAATEVRQDAIEPDAEGLFAPAIPVHEVRAWVPLLFRLLTLGSAAWRTWLPMYWRGRALLGSGRFDLVYFSTTTVNLFSFGRPWRQKFRIPYVLDFQDPWVVTETKAAAQGWKAHVAARLDPPMEKRAVLHASGIVAVSPHYIEALKRRYGKQSPIWLRQDRHAVVPFCAIEGDLAQTNAGKSDTGVARSSELVSLNYVGAGPMMGKSFSLICGALSSLRAGGDDLARRVRIRLFGTGAVGRSLAGASLKAVACESGIGNLVEEWPDRVSYRRALDLLREADGLLVLGVDDAGYMPSKLFGYALSGKPLLACLRRDGPAYASFERHAQLGHLLWFDATGTMPLNDASAIFRRYLEDVARRVRFDRRPILEEHLAPAMARRHVQIFEACLANAAGQS